MSEDLRVELEHLRTQNAALEARLQTQPIQHQVESHQVHSVSVKLPPFWADRPAVWFAQAEAQFHLAGIKNDTTMFSHVISTIDQRLIGEIEDIVLEPPPENKYNILKQELIRRLSASEQQRVERLVSDEELGDRKPTAFLRHLQSLAGKSKDDSIIRQLWMRRLPTQVQAILAAQEDLSLQKLAELADKIIEVTIPSSSKVYAVNSEPNEDPSIKDLLIQLNKHFMDYTALQTRGRVRNRPASRTNSRSGTPVTKRCWYHKKYGTNATKCTKPCDWKPENSTSSQ